MSEELCELYAYLLLKQICFICQETWGCFNKSLFSQVKPRCIYLQDFLLPVWPFWNWTWNEYFTHTHLSQLLGMLMKTTIRSIWQTSCPLRFFLNSIPAGSCWLHRGQGASPSDARLGICHFKAWVKRPLRLLIGLSSLITPGLCIALSVTVATATSTLNLSSFNLLWSADTYQTAYWTGWRWASNQGCDCDVSRFSAFLSYNLNPRSCGQKVNLEHQGLCYNTK